MTSERWRRVEEICHAALSRSAADRAAFIRSACGADDALRQDVEGLLTSEINLVQNWDDDLKHRIAR